MNNGIKKTAALFVALSGFAAYMPANMNSVVMQVQAETIKGIKSLSVHSKNNSAKEIKLYSDMACTNETEYKAGINKYYVELPADQGKFNIDVDTKSDYSAEIYFDGEKFVTGDEIEIIKGDTQDVRIKVYKYDEEDDRDEIQGTITITVKRDDGKTKTESSAAVKNDTASTENTSTTTTTTVAQTQNITYKNQWVQKGIHWVYYNADGNILRNGWFKDPNSGKWYYLQTNGYMTTGWRFIDSEWYFFNKSGAMQTGWMKDSVTGKWYYFYDNGVMARNTTIEGYRINIHGQAIY